MPLPKRLKTALWTLAAIAGLVVATIAGAIAYVATPTRGEHIANYAAPRKALLVIDIQEDYTGAMAKPPFPYKNAAALIAATNAAVQRAATHGMVVVYVRQEFDGFWGRLISRVFAHETALKGSPGAGLDRRVLVLSSNDFSKPKGDAFSNPALGAFLVQQQVDELYLAGLDAQYCVHNTAKGALNRGYRVHILTDAIALMAEKRWDALLTDYRSEGIRLTSSAEI